MQHKEIVEILQSIICPSFILELHVAQMVCSLLLLTWVILQNCCKGPGSRRVIMVTKILLIITMIIIFRGACTLGQVRLILPGELAKHAVSEGTKAVTKFTSATAK